MQRERATTQGRPKDLPFAPDIDGEQDDKALDDVLKVGIDPHQVEAVVENAQKHCTDQRTEDQAASTGNRGSAAAGRVRVEPLGQATRISPGTSACGRGPERNRAGRCRTDPTGSLKRRP